MVLSQILIIYAFAERNGPYITNLLFLLKNIKEKHSLIIVCNGKTDVLKNIDSPNITILYRNNIGGDFAAYGYGLKHALSKNIEYTHFIFLNDTCIGPCLPNWANSDEWPSYFIQLLSDKIKLVGPTKNYAVSKHIQSYAMATDKIGINILLKNNIFDPTINNFTDRWNYIVTHEIGSSKAIISEGYDVESFYQLYEGHGDPYFTNLILNPVELMFVKNNKPTKLNTI